jgi:DNA-binding HxlR family transcriptional regulator
MWPAWLRRRALTSPVFALDIAAPRADAGGVRSYGQYCPLARACELVTERWTLLVVRNLMLGAETFTAISRGVPHMSRSMLVRRLQELERAGLVERRPKSGGGSTYHLTDAGRDLNDAIDALSRWGERWVEVGPEMTDPGFALWAWSLVQVDPSSLPDERTVVAFRFPDQPAGNRYFWLLVEDGRAELCYSDPGDEAAALVVAESGAFVDWHRGALSWSTAVRSGRIRVSGRRHVVRALPGWNRRPKLPTTARR